MAGRRPRHVALDGVEPADRRRLVRRGPGVSGAVTAGTRIVPGHGRSALGGSTRIDARRRRLTPRGSSLRLEQRFSAWDLRPADDGFLRSEERRVGKERGYGRAVEVAERKRMRSVEG